MIKTWEINYSAYATVIDAEDADEATDTFRAIMADEYPDIEIDRVISVEEVKV